MFGSNPRRRPYDTPGIGDEIGGAVVDPRADPGQLGMLGSVGQIRTKPKFFGEGGAGRGIAGSIGDFLLQQAGARPIYAPAMQRKQQNAFEDEQYQRRLSDQLAIADQKAMQPQVFSGNEDRVQYDPVTGENKVIYDAPDEAPKPSEQERLLELWHSLPDQDPRKNMVGYMLRGAGLRADVYQPKVDYETSGRLRVKTAAPGKAASTARGGKSGSGGKAPKLPAGFILD